MAKKPAKLSCARGNRERRRRPAPFRRTPRSVTRAPPHLSATQPVSRARQRADQRAEEGVVQGVDLRELRLGEQRERRRVADERAEGAGVEPAHDPVVLALEDHGLLGEGGLAPTRCRSCRTRRRRRDATMNGTQMKPAFCSHIGTSGCLPSTVRHRRRASRTRRR